MSLSRQSTDPARRLRILFVANRVPSLPLLDGYVLHLWHLIVEMAEHHEIRLLVPENPDPASTRVDGAEVVVDGAGGDLRAALERVAGEFSPDVVHLVGGSLAGLWRAVPEGAVSVLGALDAAHLNVRPRLRDGARRAARAVARRRIILWRSRRTYWRFDRVVVVSEEDRRALEREDRRISIEAIANGVDLSKFAPRTAVEREPGHLVFTGALDYAPNVETAEFLAREVMPVVNVSAPAARLHLVGRDPSDEVLSLDGLPGVTVVGPVEHMADALSRASIYVCPMVSGTGIKNKLLEAFANGLPCIASGLAVRGMTVRHGEQVLIADSAKEVAAAVLELLEDDRLRKELGASGQEYVAEHHTWTGMAHRYSALYHRLIED